MQMRVLTVGSVVIGTEINYLCVEAGHYVSLTSINGGKLCVCSITDMQDSERAAQTRQDIKSLLKKRFWSTHFFGNFYAEFKWKERGLL